MDKSFHEYLNVSRSSSQSRRQQVTDRSQLADCTDIIQKYSLEYKDTSKDLQSHTKKLQKYKENIEIFKKLIQSCEIETSRLESSITILQNQTEKVTQANQKIFLDTDEILEEKNSILNKLSKKETKYTAELSLTQQITNSH